MNSQVIEKVDSLICALEEDVSFQRWRKLKKQIKSDKEIAQKVKRWKEVAQGEYSSQYVAIKKELLEDPLMKEYLALEKKIYFFTLELNKKLNELMK